MTWAALLLASTPAMAAQSVLPGPPGSGEFGTQVHVLPNGNIVVTDPSFDGIGTQVDIGAVHLYRPNGVPIASLHGTQAGDRVGSGGVTVLDNGHYVVQSPDWQNDVLPNAGAATWCDADAGLDGAVGMANSLVGGSAGDAVGRRVLALRNGNYVVASRDWDRGTIFDAGAVTLGSGIGGIAGAISPQNSLVGTQPFDAVGTEIVALSNGNYVVGTPDWNRGSVNNAGAATFGSGLTGIVGDVSIAQSLVGSSDNDRVGEAVWALANGNYVVTSFNWNNGAELAAGAATFGSGTQGVTGAVSATNSLVGTLAFSVVGKGGIAVLGNGNYVVQSPEWNDGSGPDVGAATFGSGTAGISGIVSSTNSLVGRRPGDAVGTRIEPLAHGHYAVISPFWNDGPAVAVGAVTFGPGDMGISGEVVPANSMIGSRSNDRVGSSGVAALGNGNYVIGSPSWDDPPLTDVGAATFVDVTAGTAGTVSAGNSLIGSNANDEVGIKLVALPHSGYVVGSPGWDRGSVVNAGAVTRGSDAVGIIGVVSTENSLFGTTQNDRIPGDIVPLATGDFVLRSPSWTNDAISRAGAVTFWRASDPLIGTITPANSLVGTTALDFVGDLDIHSFANGNYLSGTRHFDDVGVVNAGALTLGLRDGRVAGPVTTEHSVVGTIPDSVDTWRFAYDDERNQLAVGQPLLNRVVLQRSGLATAINIIADGPDPSVPGADVTFTAIVSAATAPTEGSVRFRAGSGEGCSDADATAIGPGLSGFSCSIVFDAVGTVEVIAEYAGSFDFAYGGSAVETHEIRPVAVFGDGFESPSRRRHLHGGSHP